MDVHFTQGVPKLSLMIFVIKFLTGLHKESQNDVGIVVFCAVALQVVSRFNIQKIGQTGLNNETPKLDFCACFEFPGRCHGLPFLREEAVDLHDGAIIMLPFFQEKQAKLLYF